MAIDKLKGLGLLFTGLGILILSVAVLIGVLKGTGRIRYIPSEPLHIWEGGKQEIGSAERQGKKPLLPILDKRLEEALQETMSDPAVVDELQKEIEKHVQSEEFREQLRESFKGPSFGNVDNGSSLYVTPESEPILRAGRIVAPVVYQGLMLVLSNKEAVAVVDFTEELEKGVTYRYRCRLSASNRETTGTGKLFEKYKRVASEKPDNYTVVDEGGQLVIKAGPFRIEWSWRCSGEGWIYYSTEDQRVEIAHDKDFDNLDLSRFTR